MCAEGCEVQGALIPFPLLGCLLSSWAQGSVLRLSPWVPISRSASLAQVNAMLREQLDQANTANQALSEDIRKLTADWTKARDELEQREVEWRREEEVSAGEGVLPWHRARGR